MPKKPLTTEQLNQIEIDTYYIYLGKDEDMKLAAPEAFIEGQCYKLLTTSTYGIIPLFDTSINCLQYEYISHFYPPKVRN